MSLKVLHVINGLGPAGAETVLYRLATRKSDVQHEIICLTGRDRYSPLLEEQGVTIHHLNMTSILPAISGARQLPGLIRRSEADVVQCWMYRSNLLGGLFGRQARLPVVWNIRCSSLGPLRLSSRLVVYAGGLLARWVPDFVVNCSERSTELHARLGYSAVDGCVIANGYDPEEFFPDEAARESVRHSLAVPDDAFVIGSVARWHQQKNIPQVLRAIRLAIDKRTPVRCILVGHELDPGNAELAKAIERAGMSDLVLTLGRRSDLASIARAMDLHVLASVGGEGFPNTVAETMLSAIPNVVTDVGDSGLIVGETGWVIAPGDLDQLTTAISAAHREWAERPEKWQERRTAARKRIAGEFSLDRMAAAYERVWRKVARRPGNQSDSSRSSSA